MGHVGADLRFEDLSFEAVRWTPKGPQRDRILHGMSGEFVAGKLSAIMGPSGAGKSTLLRILAGYSIRGVQGEISSGVEDVENIGCCGGKPSGVQNKKRGCLIRQDDHLRLSLTVSEAMGYAAHLKIGGRRREGCCEAVVMNVKQRQQEVLRILRMLGLEECLNRRTNMLSGGQKKRLSVALELLNDPPIMLLDEPTTGLDSASCSQCVALLKTLAAAGRNIICTIHQPSALLLQMFDHLYVVAAGKCVYRGTVPGLVPFLSSAAYLQCPSYHNPADFLIESLSAEESSNQTIALLSSAVQNGQMSVTDSGEATLKVAVVAKGVIADNDRKEGGNTDIVAKSMVIPNGTKEEEKDLYPVRMPASSVEQFFILYRRNVLMMRRNYINLSIRIAAHLAIGVIFGYLYRDVGNEGSTVLSNYVFIYGSLLFLVYTGKMSVLLSFPLELEIVCQEHFNRWYSLIPYCLSTLMVEIPFQAFACLSYLGISYVLTGQPMESSRLIPFFTFNIIASLAAQSCGYLIGATLQIKVAVFVGPVIAVLLSVFGFCISYRDTPDVFKWLFHVSYFRYALHANTYILYGQGRGVLPCSETKFYCHFKYPEKFLTEMDIGEPGVDIVSNLYVITTFTILIHCLTFLSIWLRLHYLR